MAIEEEEAIVYYCTNNTRVYHEVEQQSIAFPIEAADAIDMLLTSYPVRTFDGIHHLLTASNRMT